MRFLILLFALGAALAQDYIDGEYFIHLDQDIVRSKAQEDAFVAVLKSDFNIEMQKFYRPGQKKFLFVKGSAGDVARAGLLKEVTLVEQNALAYATQDCSAVGHPGVWGLDRIDQTAGLPYTSPSDPSATYMWDSNDGTGVSVYVFDTGIDFNHSNFEGRASFDYVASEINNQNPGDFNGHGTHCAGTVASRDYGVAKGATVHAVKILNDSGSGPWSAIIEGMDWLTALSGRPSHAAGSMSVGGGGQNTAVQASLEALVASGVPVAVSAGNSDTDACSQTPAFIPDAITVGSTTVLDTRSSFSNYGTCVDIFAPGSDVLSTTPGESTDIYSGTSMACPHVAGAVARFMSSQSTAPTPADVVNYLTSQATPGVITNLPAGTPNLLLFTACSP